jgi:hypothetical protein
MFDDTIYSRFIIALTITEVFLTPGMDKARLKRKRKCALQRRESISSERCVKKHPQSAAHKAPYFREPFPKAPLKQGGAFLRHLYLHADALNLRFSLRLSITGVSHALLDYRTSYPSGYFAHNVCKTCRSLGESLPAGLYVINPSYG